MSFTEDEQAEAHWAFGRLICLKTAARLSDPCFYRHWGDDRFIAICCEEERERFAAGLKLYRAGAWSYTKLPSSVRFVVSTGARGARFILHDCSQLSITRQKRRENDISF